MPEMTREEALRRLRRLAGCFSADTKFYGDTLTETLNRCADTLEAPTTDDRDAEERRAWDMYAAGLLAATDLSGEVYTGPLARVADRMLTERRARFPKGGV